MVKDGEHGEGMPDTSDFAAQSSNHFVDPAQFVEAIRTAAISDAEANEELKKNPILRHDVVDLLKRRADSLERDSSRIDGGKWFKKHADFISDALANVTSIYIMYDYDAASYDKALKSVKELASYFMEGGEPILPSSKFDSKALDEDRNAAMEREKQKRRKAHAKEAVGLVGTAIQVIGSVAGASVPAATPVQGTTGEGNRSDIPAHVYKDKLADSPFGSKPNQLSPGVYSVGKDGNAAQGDYLLARGGTRVCTPEEVGSYLTVYVSDEVEHTTAKYEIKRANGSVDSGQVEAGALVQITLSEGDAITLGKGLYAQRIN